MPITADAAITIPIGRGATESEMSKKRTSSIAPVGGSRSALAVKVKKNQGGTSHIHWCTHRNNIANSANQTTVTTAGSQGHFELNVYKPVMADALLQSVRLLADGAVSFADKCVVGIEANRGRITELMERSLMLVTALAPEIGYDNATAIAKKAHKNGTTLREEAVGGGYVSAETFDRVVRPEKMVSPG